MDSFLSSAISERLTSSKSSCRKPIECAARIYAHQKSAQRLPLGD
jgi:hypothetical protein